MNAKVIWQTVKDQLRSKIDPFAFTTWIENSAGSVLEDGMFIVHVGTSTTATALERRYYHHIQSVLLDILGYSVEVKFVVVQEQRSDVEKEYMRGQDDDPDLRTYVGQEVELRKKHEQNDVDTGKGQRKKSSLSPDHFFFSSTRPGSLPQRNFGNFPGQVPNLQEGYITAMEYAMEPSAACLLLVGPVTADQEKMHLAAAAAWSCLERSYCHEVFFARCTELFALLQSAFNQEGESSYEMLVQRIRAVDLLVLNDLKHPSRMSDETTWFDQVLYRLVRMRLDRGNPTILTARPESLFNLDSGLRWRLSGGCKVRTVIVGSAQE